MSRTSPLHWVGTTFLLLASILLLITTISAPVLKDIAILKVMLTNKTDIRNSSVIFGTLGHCILDVPPVTTDQDFCFPKSVGYKPADIMQRIDPTTHFAQHTASTINNLTGSLVLHPITCALAFIAFVLSCGAGVVGSLLAASVGGLAWALAVVSVGVDFWPFGILKSHINASRSGLHAYYSVAMWTLLAGMLLLFFGTLVVLVTCFSKRKERRSGGYVGHERRMRGKENGVGFVDDGGVEGRGGGVGMGGDGYGNRAGAGYDGVGAARGKKRFGIF